MSGYEKSPDYGGSDPPPWFPIFAVVVIVLIGGGFAALQALAS